MKHLIKIELARLVIDVLIRLPWTAKKSFMVDQLLNFIEGSGNERTNKIAF